MESIQKYYAYAGVPKVYSADAKGLLNLACIAERNALQIMAGPPAESSFEAEVAWDLMLIAEKRLDVCMCIIDQGCDGTCTSCVKAFEEMLRAEEDLEILSK